MFLGYKMKLSPNQYVHPSAGVLAVFSDRLNVVQTTSNISIIEVSSGWLVDVVC